MPNLEMLHRKENHEVSIDCATGDPARTRAIEACRPLAQNLNDGAMYSGGDPPAIAPRPLGYVAGGWSLKVRLSMVMYFIVFKCQQALRSLMESNRRLRDEYLNTSGCPDGGCLDMITA